MERRPLKRLGAMIAAGAIALMLIGCRGTTGPNGLNGTNGTNGTNGKDGQNGTPGTSVAPINAGDLSSAAWSALNLKGSVASVDMSSGTPKVTFNVTDQNGNGIAGLTGPGPDGLSAHMAFSIAKLIPAGGTTAAPTPGSPSRWVNYLFVVPAGTATAASFTAFPDPETTGTLKDNLDGSYTYTFNLNISQAKTIASTIALTGSQTLADLDDLTYDQNALHRLAIFVGGAATGTAVHTPVNIIYDFIPANANTALPAGTDERQVVAISACNACHTKLAMHGDRFPPVTDTQACVVCHTDQMKFGYADSRSGDSLALAPVTFYGQSVTFRQDGVAVPLFPNFIHKIHMGDQLASTGNALFGTPFDTRYPQDIRNCTTCHTGTAVTTPVPNAAPTAALTTAGDNWMKVPSRMACGSCHDNVIFSDGTNHGPNNLAQPDDSVCNTCHNPSDVAIEHIPVWTVAQAGGSSYQATNPGNLPAGAHRVQWNVKSVSVDVNNIPSIEFNYLVDGQPYVFGTDTTQNMMSGALTDLTAGANGPLVMLAFGVPQDGIPTPADFNARGSWQVQQIFNGTAKVNGQPVGTFAPGPDAGYYTITLNNYPLPANTGAVMMGIGLGLLTQSSANLPVPDPVNNLTAQTTFKNTPMNYAVGGLFLPTKIAWMSAPVVTGNTVPGLVRRNIITPGACESCHGNLGAFTTSTAATNNFHSVGIGDGNDGTSCVFCHNTTGVDGAAWSYNTKTWIHAIHGASKRVNAYTAHASRGSTFYQIAYPGLLNNCEACHVAGSYDFSNSANSGQLPNLLWETVAKGNYPLSKFYPAPAAGAAPSVPTGGTLATPAWLSPFIDQTGTVTYGGNWTITPPAVANPTAANWTITPPVAGPAGVASLVTSPITGACVACHDSSSAIAHMRTQGGYFYTQRTQVQNPTVAGTAAALPNTTNTLVTNEQCLVCHGAGTVMDIKTVHMNF